MDGSIFFSDIFLVQMKICLISFLGIFFQNNLGGVGFIMFQDWLQFCEFYYCKSEYFNAVHNFSNGLINGNLAWHLFNP